MPEHTHEIGESSTVVWESLESWVREEVRRRIQEIIEDEVAVFLGRDCYQRRSEIGAPKGYRNGHGKPRRLTLSSGTITLRRPRVRNTEDRFESRILPLFARRTQEVGDLIPELYLHGLAEGDFDLALRGLLGDDAPLSPSTVARLKATYQVDFEAWKRRPLTDEEVVYLWVDGVYVKAGLEKEKAALLVAVAALRDGSKVVIAVEAGYRESVESWATLLRDLKARGMSSPRLVIGDGNLGLWGALSQVYPDAGQQRCWNHRIVNVLDALPKKAQPEAKALLTPIPYSETRKEAEEGRKAFESWCRGKGYVKASERLDHDWERMVAFYDFPQAHWKHLRTTNVIESPFAAVRLRTTAAKRFKKVENATAVIWKTLMIAESRFRRLDAPELLIEVAEGVRFRNGVRVRSELPWEAAAD